MRTLESVVAEMSIFAGMPSEDKALIAGCASNVRFAPGELLSHEGTPANSFYFLRRGRVAVELFVPHRGGVAVEELGAGDVVGWSWLLPPYRYHFDTRAIEPVLATAFDGSCLRAKCDRDARFGYELMLRFSQIPSRRLRAARLHFANIQAPSTIAENDVGVST
jgi:CRP/FNR family cyclic AMP-dependent transcriptional regulator